MSVKKKWTEGNKNSMEFSFKKFLIEEEKVVYFTFGRMNPPTIGHEKVLNKLSQLSKQMPYRIYLSQSQDEKKNPLNYRSKVKYARKMFPKHARSILNDATIKNPLHALVKLYNEGFKKVVMVAGSDRVNEYKILINKYNGKKFRDGFYNFQSLDVVSAGERDPDAEGAMGMSATKMRSAAKENDFTQFAQGLPKAVSTADAKSIYNDVRKGLGLKEQKEFKNHVKLESISETREAYVSGDLFSTGDLVVVKETSEVGKIIQCGSNYVIIETKQGQYRKWLDSIELVEKVAQDKDVAKVKGTQPKPYYKGLKKATKKSRAQHFRNYANKSDAEKKAAPYKKAPGDASAKTKPSKWTKKFKDMYGEDIDMAKKRIDREKKLDKVKHDRILDRARLRDTIKKNRETK
tara:strand:+ start:12053 stop:13267 length:1215 start_codon:yes stop_codon:yes gene_type:complete